MNAIYTANLFHPIAIISAPRFVIFVTGPVIIKTEAHSAERELTV